jgi:hypothetical protein
MRNFIISILLISYIQLSSQKADDDRIALQFYSLKEYTKAELLLKKLFDLQPEKYYDYLYKTYIQLKKYDEAIAISEITLKKTKSKTNANEIDIQYKIGYSYYKKNDTLKSKKEWLATNNLLTDNEYQVLNLLNLYAENKQWGISEDAILKFKAKSKDKNALDVNLLELYIQQKKYIDAVEIAYSIIDKQEEYYMASLSNFQFLNDNPEALKLMNKKVYSKLNANPSSEKWNEISMGLSLAIKDYEQALTISKAIDKRKHGKGQEVIHVSEIASNEGELDVAQAGYHYLSLSPYIYIAKMGSERELNIVIKQLERNKYIDSNQLLSIQQAFISYFSKYNFDNSTAEMQLLFAQFNLKYLHELDTAKAILEKLISLPQLSKPYLSRGKLDLADLKLALNDIWEASLLYGQVDKEEKDSPLGEEARFKNSKIFYYNGDYELAEDLLSILKSSTTELIANDALYLAVFIQENSTDIALKTAMKEISSAELLFYQNKPQEAFNLLLSVKNMFANSSLIDDVLNMEANYALANKNYSEASLKFKEIVEKYPKSILADRALYEWSKIEEEQNKNIKLAMENYLVILKNYKDSVYSTDVRKRLRVLRGDKLDEEL